MENIPLKDFEKNYHSLSLRKKIQRLEDAIHYEIGTILGFKLKGVSIEEQNKQLKEIEILLALHREELIELHLIYPPKT